MGSNKFIVAAAAAVLGLYVSASHAANVLDFEGAAPGFGEGLNAGDATNDAGGVVSTSFGVTLNKQALSFNALQSVQNTGLQGLFSIGTVNGTATDPDQLGNFTALNTGFAAQSSGTVSPVSGAGSAAVFTLGPAATQTYLSFDVTLDRTGVTGDGFFQLGITGNSDNGFWGLGFGGINNGNVNDANPFALSARATQLHVGLTVTNISANVIRAHYDIPMYANVGAGIAAGDVPDYGPGADGVNNFFQLSFNHNDGYTGAINLAFDNVNAGTLAPTPEPASLGLLALAAPAMLRRRKA